MASRAKTPRQQNQDPGQGQQGQNPGQSQVNTAKIRDKASRGRTPARSRVSRTKTRGRTSRAAKSAESPAFCRFLFLLSRKLMNTEDGPLALSSGAIQLFPVLVERLRHFKMVLEGRNLARPFFELRIVAAIRVTSKRHRVLVGAHLPVQIYI